MKVLQILLLVFLLTAGCPVHSESQSSDTSETVSKLVGTWQLTDMCWGSFPHLKKDSLSFIRLAFEADGSLKQNVKRMDSTTFGYFGSYSVRRDTVRIHWNSGHADVECVCLARFGDRSLTIEQVSPPGCKFELSKVDATASRELPIPRPVPNALIEELRRPDTAQARIDEVVQHSWGVLFTDERDNLHERPFLEVTEADLDGDSTGEVAALIGWSYYDTRLVVLKQYEDKWLLLSSEKVEAWYDMPKLTIVPTSSRCKPICVHDLYARGSGVYEYVIRIFRLVDGRVYDCASIVDEAHIYGWGLPLNEDEKMTDFHFDTLSDAIYVSYTYSFLAGEIDAINYSADTDDPVTFVNDKDNLVFRWDSLQHAYKPEFSNKPLGLTAGKLNRLGKFGDDSTFVQAFDDNIRQTLEHGSRRQKSVLKKYLSFVASTEKEGAVRRTKVVTKRPLGGAVLVDPLM